MTATIRDLPNKVLWQVYGYLPLKQRILLSHVCQHLRDAATSTPRGTKYQMVLYLENVSEGATFGVIYTHVDKFRSISRQLAASWINKCNENAICRELIRLRLRFTISSALVERLELLSRVASVDHLVIVTNLFSFFLRDDWSHILRSLVGNKNVSFMFTLDFRHACIHNCRLVTRFCEGRRLALEVVYRVCLLILLWKVAKTGIRSLELRFHWPLAVIPFIRLAWFAHLTIHFYVRTGQLTRVGVCEFVRFIRRFLSGEYKKSSFCFVVNIAGGSKWIENGFAPISAELKHISEELKQPNRVCYHEDATGVRSVWHTMNNGPHRVSWQGPVTVEEQDILYIRVRGSRDSENAIPQTRPLTKPLLSRMERACTARLNSKTIIVNSLLFPNFGDYCK